MTTSKEIPVEWYTKIYAPRHYGVYLISGENYWYYQPNKQEGLGFWAEAGGGWRMNGVKTSGGSADEPAKLPLGVQLTWLSMTEKKYYQANIRLPREIMLAEFAKNFDFEYYPPDRQIKFTNIEFALAPNGFVSLRLGGVRTLEVGSYQAKQIDISWDFFAMTNHFSADGYSEEEFMQDHYKKLPGNIQKLVDEDNLPVERWKNYSNKLEWHLATEVNLVGCRICCINGNNRFYNQDDIKSMEVIEQEYAPAWMQLYYKQADKRYQAIIRFTKQSMSASEQPDDDVEVYEVFKNYLSSTELKSALVLDNSKGKFTAYLTNGTKKQEIIIHEESITILEDDEFEWFV